MTPTQTKSETRSFTLNEAEVREEADGLRFEGHAAVFDQPSGDLGGFTEYVARGAFRKVLNSQPDVRFLFNHLPDGVLARTKSGTMTLGEDTKGLHVDARWAPTALAKDLQVLVARGDVDQMSFGFRVGVGNDSWADQDGESIRTIRNFEALYDVSLVTFPAYPQTDAALRSHVLGVEVRDDSGTVLEDHLQELAHSIYLGKVEASAEERAHLDRLFTQTALMSPWEAERAAKLLSEHPDVIPGKTLAVSMEALREEQPAPAFRLSARKRRLALIAPPEKRMAMVPAASVESAAEQNAAREDAEPSMEPLAALSKIDSLTDGIEQALGTVGIGDVDDAPAEGTFSAEQYGQALSAVQNAVEEIEDALEAAGYPDPDRD